MYFRIGQRLLLTWNGQPITVKRRMNLTHPTGTLLPAVTMPLLLVVKASLVRLNKPKREHWFDTPDANHSSIECDGLLV